MQKIFSNVNIIISWFLPYLLHQTITSCAIYDCLMATYYKSSDQVDIVIKIS